MPIAMLVDIAIKERKIIVNAIGNTYLKFKDKKGVITEMDFYFNKLKYSTRFSTEDFKWHCVNPKDAKVKVSDDILLTSLKSEAGKKFRKYCKDTWDPIFNSTDNDQLAINFSEMLKNPTEFGFDKKTTEYLKDFVNNWKKIEESCLSDNYKFDIKMSDKKL